MLGWKTKIGGYGAIVWAVAGFVLGYHGVEEAANLIVGGFSVLGIGHKIDKMSN